MNKKVANILGLNRIYVILSHDTMSSDSVVLNPVFTNKKDAEKFARKHEKDNNYQFYTEIYKMEVV